MLNTVEDQREKTREIVFWIEVGMEHTEWSQGSGELLASAAVLVHFPQHFAFIFWFRLLKPV